MGRRSGPNSEPRDGTKRSQGKPEGQQKSLLKKKYIDSKYSTSGEELEEEEKRRWVFEFKFFFGSKDVPVSFCCITNHARI